MDKIKFTELRLGKPSLLKKIFQHQNNSSIETIKLGLIERIMKVHKGSILQRMIKMIIQDELGLRGEKSLEAIEMGNVLETKGFQKRK